MPPYLLENSTATMLHTSSTISTDSVVAGCSEPLQSGQQTTELPPQHSQVVEHHTVSFFTHAAVIAIENAQEAYTKEEVHECWYGKEDFAEIQLENQSTIRNASNGQMEGKGDTMRGLESFLHENQINRQLITSTSMGVVLNEQTQQRLLDCDDPDYLRECYESTTSRATSKALDAAYYDALEARAIGYELHGPTREQQADVSADRCCWLLNPAVWFPRLVQKAIVGFRSEWNGTRKK